MKIEPTYFLLSMFVTLFILYIYAPEPQIMVKYPNLKKDTSDVYVDDRGTRYIYRKIQYT